LDSESGRYLHFNRTSKKIVDRFWGNFLVR